jgi:hypothetical protein
VFSAVSSVCTSNADGSGDCGSGVFIAEDVGVGDKWLGDTHNSLCRDCLGGCFGGYPDLG